MRAAAISVLSALALAWAGPASADDAQPDDPVNESGQAPITATGPEQTAQQQALTTGTPVPVDALTTQTDQVTAEPDGSFTRTSYVQPVRVNQDGAWTAVDATLAPAGGGYAPIATPSHVLLSDGGNGPLATLTDANGNQLAYTFPVPLPAPTVTGSTALYPDVLPGVDLQADVTDQGGFSEVLIVHDATAAANPILHDLHLATTTQGLTLSADAAGNIAARTSDGTATFTSPTPVMWDSSTTTEAGSTQAARTAVSPADLSEDVSSVSGPGQGARVAEVGVSASSDGVTLSPDQDLLGGSATTYPVYIDPYTSPGTLKTGGYTEATEGCPDAKLYNTPQDNGEGVGYQQYASNCFGLERSYFAINTSSLDSSMVFDSATLHLTETYGADHGCSNTWPLTVKATGAISASTSWNNQPGVSATVKASIPVKSAAAGCGDRSVSVDVKSQIAAVAGVHDTWTFGLFGDETKTSSNLGFMRFAVNPYVTTVYDIPPSAPTNPSTTPDSINPSGPGCGSSSIGWIGRTTFSTASSNITLNAKLTSAMTGANLRGQYSVWDYSSGSALTHPADSPAVASGGTARTSIGFVVKDGHRYGWNVKAYDGNLSGPATATCHFNVDLQPPTPAHIDDSTAFPPLGSTASPTAHAGDTGLTVHVSSTDVAPTGCTPTACVSSGIDRFEYSMDTPIPPSGAASETVTPDASGTATADIPLSVSAQQWGTHTLYVRAVDGANNSSTATYRFYAPWNPDLANLVEPGDLDGDGIPDTITPAPDGSLQLLSGDAGTSTAPQTSSPAANAPDCPTDTPDCHPDHPGWSNFLVTHRGSYVQSGVDDLLAYSRNDHMLYLYVNDANGLTGDDRTTAAGHFTKDNVVRMSLKPQCSGTDGCSNYETNWDGVQQLIAAGDATNSDGPPSLITVENGHLWFYSGSRNAAAHLSAAKLLGTGDWSGTTLIAPGAVNGNLTLWVRNTATGLVTTYPIPLGTDRLPTTLLTPPAAHPLISAMTASDGSSLCVDVRQNLASRGTPVQAYTCNDSPAQHWTLGTDKSVRASGHCLDVTGGATAAGTPVELYTCNAGAAQQWEPDTDGTLRNPASGRCLTIPSDQTPQKAQLVLDDCTAADGQRWAAGTTGTIPAQEPLLPLNLTTATYPAMSSPGDANTPGSTTPGTRDGAPDLYVTDARGQVIEYPGAPALADIAQFATPVELGYLSGSEPPTSAGDLDGDQQPDLATIDGDGHMCVYAGDAQGHQNRITRSSRAGWTGADISHRGDYNGDGYEDLIAHMPNDPVLRLYPGDGSAGNAEQPYLTIPRPAGSPSPDWSKTTQVIAAGDVNFDAYPDLLAVEDDALYLFPGTSNGHVGTPTMIGTSSWSPLDLIVPGDVNGDGLNDLWARNRTTGVIHQYLNDTSNPGTALGSGPRAMTIGTGFTSAATPGLAVPGDATGDGRPDLWATWTSDNHLHFYPGNGKAGTDSTGSGFGTQSDVSGSGWTTTIKSIS